GLIGRTVVNGGVPADTTDDGLARLQPLLDEVRPALVILCLGGNDMLRHVDEARTTANLRAMVAMIKASGADVILVALPSPGLILSTASFYKGIARDDQVPCECDALSDILSSPGLKSDQVHPNAAGYQKLAAAIANVIDSHP
ncbi:MAG TPA: GDSL-type esterase/lipase family protein, partial [Kiritimatiellia bacterium]